MPFCPECGNPFESGQDFCRSCGASLIGVVPGPSQSPSSRLVTSRAGSHGAPSVHAAQPELRPKGAIPFPALVLGAIVIVLVIGAAAFFILTGPPLPAGGQNTTDVSRSSGTLPVNGQCSDNLSLCSGKCVDLTTDQDNCGACGFTVPFGETCVNGQFSSSSIPGTGTTTAGSSGMQVSCPSGQTTCSGTCRNLLSDTAHCGSCGNACPTGQTCRDGRCVIAGTATTVLSTSTTATLIAGLSCSGREAACGNSCVNLFTDKYNCGVCGRACGSQEICVNARCGPACTESGTTLCDDTCVDLDTDMNNCGACGTECETFLPNAKGALCTYGECRISGCKTDYADCDRNVDNGCEIFLRTDASNCGSCGKTCPSGQVCYSMKCSNPVVT